MDRHIEVGAGAESICEVAPYHEAPLWTQESWARGLANARLIARAPALHAENEALRAALEELLNYAGDVPCESSRTGECDKRYHNDHAAAILAASALLRASVGEGNP